MRLPCTTSKSKNVSSHLKLQIPHPVTATKELNGMGNLGQATGFNTPELVDLNVFPLEYKVCSGMR